MDGVLDWSRRVAQTIWIGGVWTIGLIVAPLLFSALSRDVASGLTWRLLGTMGWVGLVCAAVLLVDWLWRHGLAGMALPARRGYCSCPSGQEKFCAD